MQPRRLWKKACKLAHFTIKSVSTRKLEKMIKIRLARHGKRNDPFYRIVAIDSRKKRGGEPLQVLGYWHPAKNTKKLEKDAIEKWIKKGAQMTQAVQDLIEGKEGKKKTKKKKANKKKKEESEK